MTDKAISPLRRRMIEDMTIRKLEPKTQASYIRAVRNFTIFLGRSPDQASAEDLRRYQLYLASSGVAVPSQNATVTALRFFFAVTLKRSEITQRIPFVREPRKLPVVLSPEKVARFLQAAPGLKYRAALSVAYGAGLRQRSDLAQDRRHRQHPDGHPGRARQWAQGPLRDAVWASVGAAARMVEGRAATGLAVSRAEPGQPADDTPAQPRLPRRGSGGWDRQARLSLHASAQLRHPSGSVRIREREVLMEFLCYSLDILGKRRTARSGRSAYWGCAPCLFNSTTTSLIPCVGNYPATGLR